MAGITEDLLLYATEHREREVCGYLVQTPEGHTRIYRATNVHPDSARAFVIPMADKECAEDMGNPVAIFHSHPATEQQEFSLEDIAACDRGDVPWILLLPSSQTYKIRYPQSDRPPLEGRQFIYGVFDCYSLLQDAFSDAGVVLGDYPRRELFEWDIDAGWNLYEEHFETEGFKALPPNTAPKKYDLLLMRIQSEKTNHAGIFWDEERGLFLHHIINRLSGCDVWRGYWAKNTVWHLRHSSFL